MLLDPTPENFRAEIGRHRLTREAICEKIGMHPNELTPWVNERIDLPEWAAHNIGLAINQLVGRNIFAVDMRKGRIAPRRGRPPTAESPAMKAAQLRRKMIRPPTHMMPVIPRKNGRKTRHENKGPKRIKE